MCRLFVYSSVRGLRLFKETIDCFVKSSLNDVYLNEISPRRRSHNHGWGFAAIVKSFDECSQIFFRTTNPIERSEVMKRFASLPKDFDWIAMVVHSRLAGREEPIDVVNTHPFYASIPGRASIWLVHNGSVDKDKLSSILKLEKFKNMYSDTYFFAQWFAQNLEKLDVNAIADLLKDAIGLGFVRTALNIAALAQDEISKKVILIIFNYIVEEDEKKRRYYTIHKVLHDRTLFIAASSTTALYIKKKLDVDSEAMENGELIVVEPTDTGIKVASSRVI